MTDFHRIIPHRLHVPEKWRALIEEEVERLVRILDRIDGDPDLEPEGDEEPDPDSEPELGWTDRQAETGRYPFTSFLTDEGEPSLGSLECMDQRRWSRGRNDDGEPSLAAPEPYVRIPVSCYGYNPFHHPWSVMIDGPRFDLSYSGETSQVHWSAGKSNECEGDEHDGSEPDIEEASLGSLHCIGTCTGYGEVGFDAPHAWDQTRWALGWSEEHESDEHDGREPDTDGEDLIADFRGGSVIAADEPAPDYPPTNS